MIEWDREPVIPFTLRIAEDKEIELEPDNVAVYTFRERPEMSHVYIKVPPMVIFECDELACTLVGEAPTGESDGGWPLTLKDTHGWLAKHIIEDYPNEQDLAAYEKYLTKDLGDIALNGLPDEWPEA